MHAVPKNEVYVVFKSGEALVLVIGDFRLHRGESHRRGDDFRIQWRDGVRNWIVKYLGNIEDGKEGVNLTDDSSSSFNLSTISLRKYPQGFILILMSCIFF